MPSGGSNALAPGYCGSHSIRGPTTLQLRPASLTSVTLPVSPLARSRVWKATWRVAQDSPPDAAEGCARANGVSNHCATLSRLRQIATRLLERLRMLRALLPSAHPCAPIGVQIVAHPLSATSSTKGLTTNACCLMPYGTPWPLQWSCSTVSTSWRDSTMLSYRRDFDRL